MKSQVLHTMTMFICLGRLRGKFEIDHSSLGSERINILVLSNRQIRLAICILD